MPSTAIKHHRNNSVSRHYVTWLTLRRVDPVHGMLVAQLFEPTGRQEMSIENESRAPSLNEIKGEIADAELNSVSGGDKATTTKTTTKPKDYLVITMQDVIVS
jgi:hypothetical protein